MALLQTVQLEHLPSSHCIHIALYRDIKNAAFLQQQLLDGNTDYEYALIDASVVRPLSHPPVVLQLNANLLHDARDCLYPTSSMWSSPLRVRECH